MLYDRVFIRRQDVKGYPCSGPGGYPSTPNQAKSHFRRGGKFKVICDKPRNTLKSEILQIYENIKLLFKI